VPEKKSPSNACAGKINLQSINKFCLVIGNENIFLIKGHVPVKKDKIHMNHNFALLTGASAGIGKEMAIMCASKGFNLLLVSLPDRNLPSVAKELKEKFNVQVDYLETDLRDQKAPAIVYNWCLENEYEVNILINNVGTGGSERFENMTLADIGAMIQLNTCVISSLINLFIPMLKRQTKTYILNVSSTASYFNIPNKVLYAATKAFVNTLTTSLRNELANTNISVSLLCPGGSTHKIDANVEEKLNKFFVNILHNAPRSIARAGIEGMLREKRLILPGITSRLYVLVSRIVPVAFADLVVNKVFKSPTEQPAERSGRSGATYKRVAFAACLIVIIGVALNLNPTPTVNAAHKTAPLSNSEQPLVLNNPSISAFTEVDAANVAYIRNNDNRIYIYDKKNNKIVEEIAFGGKGEFKGLAYNRGYFYLLRTDGCILSIHEKSDKGYVSATYNTPLQASDNLQGLYIDTLNNRLLIDVQAQKLEDDDKNGMYAFDLVNKRFINSGAVFFMNKN
jgi:uncharacterized protein